MLMLKEATDFRLRTSGQPTGGLIPQISRLSHCWDELIRGLQKLISKLGGTAEAWSPKSEAQNHRPGGWSDGDDTPCLVPATPG